MMSYYRCLWISLMVTNIYAAGASHEVSVNKLKTRKHPYDEQYRLQYHFSAEQNWLNDPCGLIYYEGQYHLFYQYNPYGDTWGNMHWAHANSSDLVHWNHLPIALAMEDGVMIFTGSSVYDVNNTSGLGADGSQPIVAVYTGFLYQAGDIQDQRVAYSNDAAYTWTKYADNPVLDIRSTEFRDPMVFWDDAVGEWKMAITLSRDQKVLFYASADLLAWRQVGEFGPEGQLGFIWECPNLFQLAVDGDETQLKWVLEVSVNGIPDQVHDAGVQYFIGEFNGTHFSNDNSPDTVLLLDSGPDMYAPQTWSNIPHSDGRRIMIGWFNFNNYAAEMPTSPWRGSHSVPRELALKTITVSGSDVIRLCQTPIQELQSLRQGTNWEYTGLTVTELQDAIERDNIRGNTLEIIAKVTVGNPDALFGFKLLSDSEYETDIGVKFTDGVARTYANTSRAGEIFDPRFPGFYETEMDFMAPATFDFHIYVDWSSVELFAASGCAVFSLRMFPLTNPDGISVYGNDVTIDIDAYELTSIWR